MMMMKHIGPHERMFAEALLRSTLNMMCINCYQPERQCVHPYDTPRYDTRCYFNVRSKADTSQLNLPHENDN